MFRRKFLTAAIVAAVAMLASPAVSEAGFAVKVELLNAGGGVVDTVLITNDGANDNNLGDPNAIGYFNGSMFTIPGLSLSLSATRTEDATFSILTENNATVINNSGAAVRLRVTSTSTYNLPNGEPNLELLASTNYAVGTNGISFTGPAGYQAFFHKTPVDFGKDVLIASVATPSLVTQGGGGVIADPGTWALTQVMDFTLADGGRVVEFDGSILVEPTSEGPTLDVPAPSGLIMALGVVPFFAVLRRRLRKTEPTAA